VSVIVDRFGEQDGDVGGLCFLEIAAVLADRRSVEEQVIVGQLDRLSLPQTLLWRTAALLPTLPRVC